MSIGTVFTVFFCIAIVGILYIGIGYMYDGYLEKNNEMITNDEFYSGERRDALNGQFQVWYAFPVVIIIGALLYIILEALKNSDNIV